MRIVIFSDTHQNTSVFAQSIRQAIADGKIDVLIHCGDGVRDLEEAEDTLIQSNPKIRIIAVRGNCDLGAQLYPAADIADLGGVRTLVTHGHLYSVKHGLGKLSKAAQEMGMRLVFFGHTHQPVVKEKHGVLLINPGSLTALTMAGYAYLQVEIDDQQNIHEMYVKRRL